MATVQEIAHAVNSLFSLPEAAIRINELTEDPFSGDEDIAEVFLHDPSLTARLLKLANSAHYGLSRKVETVSRAIALLGRQEVRALALATSVVAAFDKIPPGVVDMVAFWSHSVSCGIVARLLGRRRKSPNRERLFICGLLHGIGKLALYGRYPEQYAIVLNGTDPGTAALGAAEREIFGFDHAELAAEMMKVWNLPETLWLPVAYYLDPLSAPESNVECRLLHIAERIARYMDPKRDFDRQVEEKRALLENPCWKKFDLTDDYLTELVEQANVEAFEVLAIVNPNALIVF